MLRSIIFLLFVLRRKASSIFTFRIYILSLSDSFYYVSLYYSLIYLLVILLTIDYFLVFINVHSHISHIIHILILLLLILSLHYILDLHLYLLLTFSVIILSVLITFIILISVVILFLVAFRIYYLHKSLLLSITLYNILFIRILFSISFICISYNIY